MGSKSDNKLLGAFANALSLTIKEHTQTKITFELIKSRFKIASDLIRRKSGNAVEIIQTGSSYDNLHMCINTSGFGGNKHFIPPTDFDYMIMFCQFRVEDFTHVKFTDLSPLDDPEINESMRTSNAAFLMIQSEHIGYVRLLVTEKGREMLRNKKPERAITESCFFPNTVFKEDHINDPNIEVIYQRVETMTFTAGGPALTVLQHEEEGYTYDFVYTFPCQQWPKIADRWNKRPRDANWPSAQLIDEIMKDGCAVVPVGFYTSSKQELEWRLSFNLSERKLSLALTTNQKLCYCVVKLLIKTSLSEATILSSYMVKNMMFWFCEQQYSPGEWHDEHVGERIIQLVDYIITALENRNIPHYFLPWNNLIRHKTSEDVRVTLDDVRHLKMSLFSTLLSVCIKMEVFGVQSETMKNVSSRNEIQSKLTLFTGFVQGMFQLGILNYADHKLAVRCFQNVVSLNTAAKSLIKTGSHMFTTTTILELLKPFAVQFMQTGEVDKALSLYKVLLIACNDDVIAKYPEAFTNVACLEAYKLELSNDNSEKEKLKKSANENFMVALKYIQDSSSLHLAYGNFLKETKLSLRNAMKHYRKALLLDGARPGDDALIQIALPKHGGTAAKMVYMPGNIVTYYTLVDILIDIGESHEARQMVRELELLTLKLDLKIRNEAKELCYHAYIKAGLHVRAELVRKNTWKEI